MLYTIMSVGYILSNALALSLFAADKSRARRGARRIRERTLLMAALFGAPGALAGMLLFSHKTRKIKFLLSVPAFCLLHLGVLWVLIHCLG